MTATDQTNRFAGRRVVIVGDLVADQFLNGTIARVSREAPVFILRHDDTATRPGAAANTAANIAALGGEAVLIGVVGEDANGGMLLDSLGTGVGTGQIVRSSAFQTTTKLRVLAGQHYAARQQVIRIDYENSGQIGSETTRSLIDHLAAAGETADAIVVSDYGYGVVTPKLFQQARKIADDRKIPLIVDSRFRLSEFVGATSATPNQDEVEQIFGSGFTDADCEKLRETLGLDALLVTRGNKGMLLIEADRPPVSIDAIGSSEPVDVTGAGDTVIAAYALGLAAGLSFAEAARIANHAGSIVVMKKGTATASLEELSSSLEEHARIQQAAPAN
ncbi:MAG: PfkB family carbohydrate kinase [Pyrinomonadaceae bacterium]